MKTAMLAVYGLGCCAAIAAGVWLADDAPAEAAASAPAAPAAMERASPDNQGTSLWAWGNLSTETKDESWDALLARALRPSSAQMAGDDSRDKLRKLAQQDPAVMQQLMASYDKQTDPQARQLIVSVLSNLEKPEVLAFSRRLALSSDSTQRKDGLAMLQNLSGDSADVQPVILHALSRDKSPEVVLMALAALKPPADGNGSAAIVAQLQELTRNADPNIRLQSIVQLAQWDKTDGSQQQWAQALADQSPQVREAAVIAIAESGARSDTVKTALLGLANNQNESKDVRGHALQVLEQFTLSKDETANFTQLRTQLLGL